MAGRTVLQAAEAIERFPLLLYKRILRFVFFLSVFLENLLFSLKKVFFEEKRRSVFFPPKIDEFRLHYALPKEARLMGDTYVRDEFRRHKNVEPAQALVFLKEWAVLDDSFLRLLFLFFLRNPQ